MVNAANDQVVMVPSASSEPIAGAGVATSWGLSNTSWSSKLSTIWDEVERFVCRSNDDGTNAYVLIEALLQNPWLQTKDTK